MDRTTLTRSGGVSPRVLDAAFRAASAAGLRIVLPTKGPATSAPVRPARAR